MPRGLAGAGGNPGLFRLKGSYAPSCLVLVGSRGLDDLLRF
jgi:hypothetical protein